MLMSKTRWIFLFATIGCFFSAGASHADEALWQSLEGTGHVLLMRHALAPGTGDPARFTLKDCSTQRNLSDEGKAQAKQIGDALHERGVAQLRVFSSQWCRCLETAQLLGFGETIPLKMANSFYSNPEKGPLQTAELIKWIRRQPLDSNILIVTHQVNITALTDYYPGSGDITVLKRDRKRGFKMLGALTDSDYAAKTPPNTLIDTRASLKRRIDEARRAKDYSAQAQHLFALALLEHGRGEEQQAHRHLLDAYTLQSQLNEHVARAHTALSLSLVLKKLGRLRSAEDAARDALVLDSDLAVFDGALNQLEQIALAYGARGATQDARRVQLEVDQLQRDALADLQKVDDYQKLARQYLNSGALRKVEKLSIEVLEITRQHDAWHQSAVAYEMLGDAYKEQDKAPQAVEYYRQGIALAKRCGSCELLERLERNVTNVSNRDAITLKSNPEDETSPRSKGIRFEPLPR